MQLGLTLGGIDPIVRHIAGSPPFHGPFGIGHECVAQITAVGEEVSDLEVGDIVVVPWAISCGTCDRCRQGLTAKCATTTTTTPGGTLSAFGFGTQCGRWGSMIADTVRVPFADHMLVKVPAGLAPLKVASASDNLADAWRAVVPHLRERPEGAVLVIGGGAKSIGLYAAGLAVAHGAGTVDYVDHDDERLEIAERLGATSYKSGGHGKVGTALRRVNMRYDIAVEASSRQRGLDAALRMLAPGGICTATGYYVARRSRLPVMSMYAASATLHAGVSHVRPILPELLDFVAATGFESDLVTTTVADWDQAPHVYATRTTKLVLHRAPLPPKERPSTGRPPPHSDS
ncbi:zinc-dependent alcohol dehydrogenase [Tsukamurella conjunctivitidis]